MFLAGFCFALAATGEPLGLAEAARLAARDAPAVRRAGEEAQVAQARRAAARAGLFPTFSAEGGVLSSTDPVDAFALALKQERLSAAAFFASDPNRPAATKDWSGALTGFWSLDLFGSARGQLRAAESSASGAGHAARRARDVAALAACDAFARARVAEESLAILSEREQDAERDAALASSLFEEGVTTAADPARARAALAEIRAEKSATRAALEEARAALAALIGADQASRPLSELPQPPPLERDEEPARRDDVLAAELAAKAAGEAAEAARAGRYPAVFLQGRYEAHAPRPGERWGSSSSVFGGLRATLFASGAVDARIAEASASARAAREGAEEARRSARRDVIAARAAADAADAREESFAAARAAAREARDIQQARYEEGLGRLSDLLEARSAELSARLAAAAARAERVVARARLRFALGLAPEGEERQ